MTKPLYPTETEDFMTNETPPTMANKSPEQTGKPLREWIEVENDCFDTSEHGVFKTTLIINRCKQLKRSVRRVRDAVTLEADTRDELDSKVAAYVERPSVKLLEQDLSPDVKSTNARSVSAESPKQ